MAGQPIRATPVIAIFIRAFEGVTVSIRWDRENDYQPTLADLERY
jgi:hypothetical protein